MTAESTMVTKDWLPIIVQAMEALNGRQMEFFLAAVEEGFIVGGVARDSAELEQDMFEAIQPGEAVDAGVLDFVRRLTPDDIRVLTAFCEGIEIAWTAPEGRGFGDHWDLLRQEWNCDAVEEN